MGTTLNKATLSRMTVQIHSVEKQTKIITVLDKIKAIIDAQQQIQKYWKKSINADRLFF